MTSDMLIRYRAVFMGGAGLVCLCYGVLALITGQPDPIWRFFPGLAGIGATAVIFTLFSKATEGSRRQAMDEVYRMENGQALAIGFWTAILCYPVFAPFLAWGWVAYPVAYAAMGTLTAAAYLISFAIVSLRGV